LPRSRSLQAGAALLRPDGGLEVECRKLPPHGKILDRLELQVDHGDRKGRVFLTYSTTPNDTDTHSLPATSAKWKHRAIHRIGDAPADVWSNAAEITVIAGCRPTSWEASPIVG
jgi:hypothetical protein